MRLDPVFVVAPQPAPPSMPTRRAFLLAGATFTLGAAVGGVGGYAIGSARASTVHAAGADLAPTGDHELDELRRLAISAPIEELIEKRLVFLRSLGMSYPRDESLWQGVVRLADALRTDPSFPDREVTARLIARTIDGADSQFRVKLSALGNEMRECGLPK